jgi:hypothetical protein
MKFFLEKSITVATVVADFACDLWVAMPRTEDSEHGVGVDR